MYVKVLKELRGEGKLPGFERQAAKHLIVRLIKECNPGIRLAIECIS